MRSVASYRKDMTPAGSRSISQNKLAPRRYRGGPEFAGFGGTT